MKMNLSVCLTKLNAITTYGQCITYLHLDSGLNASGQFLALAALPTSDAPPVPKNRRSVTDALLNKNIPAPVGIKLWTPGPPACVSLMTTPAEQS